MLCVRWRMGAKLAEAQGNRAGPGTIRDRVLLHRFVARRPPAHAHTRWWGAIERGIGAARPSPREAAVDLVTLTVPEVRRLVLALAAVAVCHVFRRG